MPPGSDSATGYRIDVGLAHNGRLEVGELERDRADGVGSTAGSDRATEIINSDDLVADS